MCREHTRQRDEGWTEQGISAAYRGHAPETTQALCTEGHRGHLFQNQR